ncbi:peptidase domain-containing ABC transporter [Marinagarivorans algicola]|uniref:peptidase domain-containing ABC transporter n=1 Tax=Marinagarivorans algicola TaxID=1513270 RepID=UPI003735804B
MALAKNDIAQKLYAARAYLHAVIHPIDSGYLKHPDITFENKTNTLIIASLAIHLLSLSLPVTTLQVYDRILVSQNLGTLNALAIGVGIAILLEAVIRGARSYVVSWGSAVYEHALSCNALRHILHTNLVEVEKEDVSQYLQRMNSISRMREFTSGQALITLIDLPFVIIYITLIAYLAHSLALVPISILLLFSVLAWALGKKIKAVLQQRDESDEKRTSFFIQVLTGIHTAKSLGHENQLQRQYEELQRQTSIYSYFLSKSTNTAVNYSALFTQMMTVSMIAFGAPMVLSGSLTMGTLIACVLLSGRIMSPVQKALGIWTRFQDYQLCCNQVATIFESPLIEHVSRETSGMIEGSIKIKDLNFSYSVNDKLLLYGINLELKRGQAISISGDHSCGKTTLLKLIAGLYLPCSGEIIINGAMAHLHPPHELIKHLGYLPMEGSIFKGTLQENLSAFGLNEDHNVKQIIQLLGIDKEIAKLPAGFETQLDGGNSDVIPPGLKQRIAIARVLSAKPKILLFDNADRGLDKEGYHLVYKLLAKLKGKVTMILISDDKNIIQLSDYEYVLGNGELTQRQFMDESKIHDVKPYQALRL